MQHNLNAEKRKARVIKPNLFLLLIGLFFWASFQLAGQDTINANGLQALETEAEAIIADPDSLIVEITEPELIIEQAYVRGKYSKQDQRRGERLFKGLVPFSSGLHNCSSCHYTKRSDTLNWNPSVYDLATIWNEDPSYRLMEKMNSPFGMRMMNDHEGMTITEADERQLEAYFNEVLKKGPGELEATPTRVFIFWGLGALMLLAIIDLLITKKIKFKVPHILIIIVGLAVHMQYAMAEGRNLGRTQGYAPDQPIKFSHLVHAGENDIDCNYCHTISSFSHSAGIPSSNTCLNCHNVIREGTYSGRFEINKIHRSVASGEPIRWIRIHKLPDHSYFSHAQHVNAGRLDCQECHGPVEEMHLLKQVEDLSMGWCLTCHRDKDVDFLDNPYYQIYIKLHQDIKDGKIDAVKAAQIGGEDCMKCHY